MAGRHSFVPKVPIDIAHAVRSMAGMTQPAYPPYKALREATGLSQRAVERALNWRTGRLSTIERGLAPTDEQRRELLAFLNERVQAATQETTP